MNIILQVFLGFIGGFIVGCSPLWLGWLRKNVIPIYKHLRTRNEIPFAGQVWRYGKGSFKLHSFYIASVIDGRITTRPISPDDDFSCDLSVWKTYVKENRIYRVF